MGSAGFSLPGSLGRPLMAAAVVLLVGGTAMTASADVVPYTDFDAGQAIQGVPEAQCGPGSSPQTDIDGRVPITDRQSGRDQKGYSCNLQLVGQYREGEGANWMDDWYGHCDYYDTLPTKAGFGTGSCPPARSSTTPRRACRFSRWAGPTAWRSRM